MSALPSEDRWLRPLVLRDLDAVLAIENRAYAHPWTRGNFVDALAAGHWSRVLLASRAVPLVGYAIAMPGVGEVHLLNLTVAAAHEHRGHARFMLDALGDECRARRAAKLWLEVRAGNLRARAVYARYGFVEAGLRRGYYPAGHLAREDAVVMNLTVWREPDALE